MDCQNVYVVLKYTTIWLHLYMINGLEEIHLDIWWTKLNNPAQNLSYNYLLIDMTIFPLEQLW